VLVATNVAPAGRTSVNVTGVDEAGPLLVTIIVYVMFWPARTGSGVSVFVTAKSTVARLTVVAVEAELLEALGSDSEPVTDAIFARVPLAVGITTTVIVDVAPTFNVPILQVKVASPEQVPWVVLMEIIDALDGTASVITTLVEVDGPRFVTLMV
jgi:hypothetical protein